MFCHRTVPHHKTETLSVINPCYLSISHLFIPTFHTAFICGVTNAIDITILQKKIVKISARIGYNGRCRSLFINFKILNLPSLFIITQVSENVINGNIHNHDTMTAKLIHVPSYRLLKDNKNFISISLKEY